MNESEHAETKRKRLARARIRVFFLLPFDQIVSHKRTSVFKMYSGLGDYYYNITIVTTIASFFSYVFTAVGPRKTHLVKNTNVEQKNLSINVKPVVSFILKPPSRCIILVRSW